METKKYEVERVKEDLKLFNTPKFWSNISSLIIDNYLWMNNKYEPKVEVKICYSSKYLFVYFRSYENEIHATYTKINDPVHKDSCVEFFINLFPHLTERFFNFEVNAIGTLHVGFGIVGKRSKLSKDEIKEIEIYSTITKPKVGKFGKDYWDIFYKIPLSIFEKYYGKKFIGDAAMGNLYKCGDDTKYEHYGVWNNIVAEKPNFHLPEFFGNIIFL